MNPVEKLLRAKARKNTNGNRVEKCACGRFKGSPICQCQINRIRREMQEQDNVQLLMQLG